MPKNGDTPRSTRCRRVQALFIQAQRWSGCLAFDVRIQDIHFKKVV